MKVGDLVYFTGYGRKGVVGIIESADPCLPKPQEREYNKEDYYWVIFPSNGVRAWIKGVYLEIFNENG